MVARSTNYRRTIATLQGLLTGLWPDTKAAVPLRVSGDADEVMFGRTDSCERLRDLMKQQAQALKGEPQSSPGRHYLWAHVYTQGRTSIRLVCVETTMGQHNSCRCI